ncbi:hypothetical protein DYB32_009884, partial [Aphanomyces invadans]
EEVVQRLRDDAQVSVVPGSEKFFGPAASGYIRISCATDMERLYESMERISAWCKTVGHKLPALKRQGSLTVSVGRLERQKSIKGSVQKPTLQRFVDSIILVDERVVLLDDLSSHVEETKKEEADRADSEAEAAARAEESAVLVREEAMKSQGKRKNREGDDEAAGGKMFKVLTLMNDANKSELELRKFMFEKELEDKKSVRCKPGNARPKLRNVKHNCNSSNYFSHP